MDTQSDGAAVNDDTDAPDKRALNGDSQPIDGTVKNDDGSVTLFLERPITVMNKAVDKLTLKRPFGKQLRGLDNEKGGAIATSFKYLATLANIPAPCMDQLDGADIQAAGDIIKGFMLKTRVAGGN